MEKTQRILLIFTIAVATGVILFISTDDVGELTDEIFTLIIALVFVSPVISSFFDMRLPKEYIFVFVIGGGLFFGYMLLSSQTLYDVVGLIFNVLFFSALSSLGTLVLKKLEKIVPPN